MGTIKRRNHSQVTEKPKGKPRKLRDNGGKRARVAREEAREQAETGKLFKGPCLPQSCFGGVEEVACVPLKNNTTHYCLCTSNGLPPTSDFKCPRSTVPVTPMPIHNIIPPTTSNTSAESRSASPASDEVSKSLVSRDVFADSTGSDSPVAGVNGAGVLLGTVVIGALVFVVLVISVIIFYVRRRIRRVDGKAQPVGQPNIDGAIST